MLCEPFRYSVPEEKKAGSMVANVLKDLKVDVKELSARRAQLISKSSRQDFQLDPHSGNIILRDKIDREALCGLTDPCTLFSEIVLENPLQVFTIEVQVEDVNDNSPTFSQNQFLFEIPEQTPINARFPLETAHDLDKGENAIQNYIISTSEYFKLDVQSQNDGSKYAELLLAKPLDREVIPQFILTLEAVDGGIPRRTGTTQIIIDILDNNDNVPQFEQAVYKVQLMENSHPGSLVAKVEATDKDIGSNARIIYTFSQAPADVLQSFSLNNHTGEITLAGKIDYEINSKYQLSIKATDGGGLSTYCKVLVDIEDENDNAPEIVVSSITNPLPENSPPETVVVLFGIRDQDSGDNGRTTCNTDKNLPFILKLTENNYYQLVTQQPLDREQMSQYNITITATDQGSPRLTSMTVISIQLSDVNDNPPMFESSFYDLHLRENNIPGLLIGSVHAVDVDTEQNAKLTYWLLPGKIRDVPASSYISINSETGNLYAIRSVDYEDIQDFQVMVRAVDKGSPPLSSETMVRVLIRDENDNAPFILCPLQNSTSPSKELVPRGAETGYLVTKVVATDRDSGQNSWLSYQLLKATDPSLFAVGTQNGEVKTMRPVNIRDTFKHTLIVAVRDNGHPPQSVSATLRILLVDGFSDPYMKIMDNPKSEVPQEEDHTLTMYLIICLVAISSIFLLSVMVFIATKFQKRRKFIGSSHSASNLPVEPSLQDKCVDPNTGTPSQAFSYEVEATDLDLGSNALILYSFHQVPERINNLFNLNERTGEITVWGQIDYEKEKSYSMNIRATDGGGLPDHCKLLIDVEDVNDNPPEVSIISLTSFLKEDSPPDTVVAVFNIRDQDSGDNSKTVCSVEMNLPFVLKSTANNFYQLVLQSPLDRETVTEYNITITAIDCGSPRLTSTRLINVQISDVNDNPPLFEKPLYDMQIRENHIPGLLIGSVHAVDLDTKQNAKVTYSVLPGKGDGLLPTFISINSETGNLYALRSLDYEQIRGFRVTVRASDGGSPSLSSEVIVRIHIIDENDNAPFFLYPLQNNTSPCNELVPKSAEAGYLVTKVVAVDADSGQNSWLSYELLKATDPALFSIGVQNGEVKTRRALNERDTNKQRLVILVRDNGLPPQTSTALLNVLLVDGFSDPFLRRVDVSVQEPEEDKTLTKYLVICLAAVSFVFLVCIVVFIVVKILKKDPQSHFSAAVPHFPPASADAPENCADSQNGSLSRTYRYDVCLTGGSLSSEFRFLRPLFPVLSCPVGDVNIPGNHWTSSGPEDLSKEVAVNGRTKEVLGLMLKLAEVVGKLPWLLRLRLGSNKVAGASVSI
ncbi:protocadherin beta-16-like [Crotalus adamanteus]|uniref:Protocadherin beta-16-like n=1 Tax=Crotalus adamanteus TaxID=8729 RepID=A0AAW1BPP3_CROAD